MTPTIDLSEIRALLPKFCDVYNTSSYEGKKLDIIVPISLVSYDYNKFVNLLYSVIGYENIAEIISRNNDRSLTIHLNNSLILTCAPKIKTSVPVSIFMGQTIYKNIDNDGIGFFHAYIEQLDASVRVPFPPGSGIYQRGLSQIQRQIKNIINASSSTLPGIEHQMAV